MQKFQVPDVKTTPEAVCASQAAPTTLSECGLLKMRDGLQEVSWEIAESQDLATFCGRKTSPYLLGDDCLQLLRTLHKAALRRESVPRKTEYSNVHLSLLPSKTHLLCDGSLHLLRPLHKAALRRESVRRPPRRCCCRPAVVLRRRLVRERCRLKCALFRFSQCLLLLLQRLQ